MPRARELAVIFVGMAIAALAMLTLTLAERRGWVPRRGQDRSRPTLAHHVVAGLVLAMCNAELLGALALPRPILAGDMRSHAMVAREIALGRASTGWVDVYHAGFPLGPHYPSVAWLLGAGLMKVGVGPEWSILLLAIAAALTTNVLVYVLALRAGASFSAALLGACTLSLIAPLTSFLGGAHAVLVLGVVSQVVVMPCLLVCAHEILLGRSRVALVVSAALAVGTHPQVAASAMALLGALSVTRGRACVHRWFRAGLVMAIVGAAIFGPGLVRLRVPFGWPSIEEWRVVGHPPGTFLEWLASGELLDFAREPVITTIVACAAVVVLLRVRRAEAARVVLLASLVGVGLCISGAPLSHMGRAGKLLLAFFQPLRTYVLLPIVASALVVVAAAELARGARALASRVPRWRRLLTLAPFLLVVAEGALLIPGVFGQARERLHVLDAGPCGAATPPGYDPGAVRAAVSRLGAGRLAYDPDGLLECGVYTDLDFASAAPIAFPFVAGAHTGVVATAFSHLDPSKPSSDHRATVLGVGYFLGLAGSPPPGGGSWQVRERLGGVTLYEVPSSYFGVGCRRKLWRGDDRHMHEALDAAFPDPSSDVWNPVEWVELDGQGRGEVSELPVDAPCDASKARLTRSERLGPGRYEARVTAGADVDVVLRETAFDWWRVEVDGVPVEPALVAPGFMSVHLRPGDHRVEAHFATSWRYLLGLLVGLCATVLLARRGGSRVISWNER